MFFIEQPRISIFVWERKYPEVAPLGLAFSTGIKNLPVLKITIGRSFY